MMQLSNTLWGLIMTEYVIFVSEDDGKWCAELHKDGSVIIPELKNFNKNDILAIIRGFVTEITGEDLFITRE